MLYLSLSFLFDIPIFPFFSCHVHVWFFPSTFHKFVLIMPDLIKCSILCLAEVLQNLVGNFVWNIAASHKTALIYSQIRRCIRILHLGYQTIIAIRMLSFPKKPKSLFTIPTPISRLETQNLCIIVSNALFVTLSFPSGQSIVLHYTPQHWLDLRQISLGETSLYWGIGVSFTLRTPISRPAWKANLLLHFVALSFTKVARVSFYIRGCSYIT